MSETPHVPDECICHRAECWGYTCSVHGLVCRAEGPPPEPERLNTAEAARDLARRLRGLAEHLGTRQLILLWPEADTLAGIAWGASRAEAEWAERIFDCLNDLIHARGLET